MMNAITRYVVVLGPHNISKFGDANNLYGWAMLQKQLSLGQRIEVQGEVSLRAQGHDHGKDSGAVPRC